MEGLSRCEEGSTFSLITPAYNEAAYIGQTIASVVCQSLRPRKWVIVSDGSTDGTDEIIQSASRESDFIKFVRRERDECRGFASKVAALRVGMGYLDDGNDAFIGHLDGDQAFDAGYFADLLARFHRDPLLGIGGGWITVRTGEDYIPRRENRPWSVCGSVQMFRRACHQDIGELPQCEYGGEDWYAEVVARMHGWRVESFPDLKVRALRGTGERDGKQLQYRYREGYMDYAMGTHPLFEIAKAIRRIPSRPYLFAALARLIGFSRASISGKRTVSQEVVAFLRREQLNRIGIGQTS